MSETYVSKALPTTIKATSSCTIKIRDNFYKIEYSEERTIPSDVEVDMEMERQLLFDDVNTVVDGQAEDILKTFRK